MNRIRLADVYRSKDAVKVLYALLAERETRVNISHRRMPSIRGHRAFIVSRPYKAWYLVRDLSGGPLGGVYLSRRDEIGVFIFKKFRGKGYGEEAVRLLMRKHAAVKRFLANINPKNRRSVRFFNALGFKHVQNTYELRK